MRKRKSFTLAILLCAAAILSLAMSIYALMLTANGIVERRNASIAQNEPKTESVSALPLVYEEPSAVSEIPVIRMEVVVTIIEEEKPAEPQQIALDAGGRGGFITDGKNDLELVAIAIYKEAGGDNCTDDTRIKVGNVIINRTKDDRFPDTVEEVLTQYRQYNTFYLTGVVWPERASYDSEQAAVARAYECAERVLLGESLLPDDVVFQAEFMQGTEIVSYQDGIYFCR